MTPKEKAEELVNKYKNPFDRKGCIPPTETIFNSTAKQLALIAVDEIQKILYSQKTTLNISAYKDVKDFNRDIQYNNDVRISSIFYFDMVKKEIENL
jgi:hypothetical protein